MILSAADFTAFHSAVHGRPPFAWQQRLLETVVEQRAWPAVLDLPTGCGKTTCIDIAVFALALDAGAGCERWCPRRIAMVVDRRTVVDQAADRGRKLLAALTAPSPSRVLAEVAGRLRSLSEDDSADPLAVFTLRGGIPKDDGWARTPDQPLIIASTVDQVGSRLLVQGYGVSRNMRPVHAGLLANDVLLLLDEVHLSNAFAETLEQLERLRQRFASRSPVAPRFHRVFLSATPRPGLDPTFALAPSDEGPGSPLSPRLRASKVAAILEFGSREALEEAAVSHALNLAEKHRVVGVVLNRVQSAARVARALKLRALGRLDVQLLTGRMRPLDRDDVLRQLIPCIAAGRERAAAGPLAVVATQCIEAGADFDFDALVTESASFDALRQRFGRLDRLGEYGAAEAIVLHDKTVKDDPIYGGAIARTVAWLKARRDRKTAKVDMGVLALPPPCEDERAQMTTPPRHAPILLPAYLDLWSQTAPEPAVVPDVALFLHGPQSGVPDVQVVWRIDLSETDLESAFTAAADDPARARPTAIVSAIPPSSLEAVAVPFAAALAWLGVARQPETADVEGALAAEDEPRSQGALVLRWAGENSEVIAARQIRPGDTVIVPATRGGIRDACFDPDSSRDVPDSHAVVPVFDLAERASFLGRGQPLLRLHPLVLEQYHLGDCRSEDLEDVRGVLARAADMEGITAWQRAWLRALAGGKSSFVVDGNPTWTVLRGARLSAAKLRAVSPGESAEAGVEITTDAEDSCHAGRPVTLEEHTHHVERLARAYAAAAGLPHDVVEDVGLAAWLHDIGKADRRFQLLLRGGSEIAWLKDDCPWAKSGVPPGARHAQRLAQRLSGYPKGARHEVQSVALVEKHSDLLRGRAHDAELVLHLVASHHGECRPFAPVVEDLSPEDVRLDQHASERYGRLDFGPVTSAHGLHRLDSPLADRFWGLVSKYGWLELCWLEAILRLADHRASEREQTGGLS
ncbi:MAG: type I-U CRISPR-associated helicase/endonuclease Cas3 [Vicinamibacterales bacterium]